VEVLATIDDDEPGDEAGADVVDRVAGDGTDGAAR
jgi:hypothetical protein